MAVASGALGVVVGRELAVMGDFVWFVVPMLFVCLFLGPGTISVVLFERSPARRQERWRLLMRTAPSKRPAELRVTIRELELVQLLGNFAFLLAFAMTYQVLGPR